MSILIDHVHRHFAADTGSALERLKHAQSATHPRRVFAYPAVLVMTGIWIIAQSITLSGVAANRPAGRGVMVLAGALPALFPAILAGTTAMAMIRCVQLFAVRRAARAESGVLQ
ncbi:hypothetical protein C5C31_13790 [Rathayibacter rathayi]|uniref:DUF4282 domain-containing protein n=1 Tax=Rathayibacter rathayi TaxID=33887 RepID=A0ABX5A7F2_RATRA|nr:hypothetical protein C5C34_10260 [Rathayibacter rathayi]SOE06006.1 hypothetical protein SAMN06295924_12213 [Rathayibacter rathayi NCPPB 2980 = VKM Ac-1601]PPF42636.1 hypothetical protein C5C08_14740 [Rathayibacter rathayi]PPF75293.1 hypothetical protein C5C14_14555 [Rathayibacter rathayi]PPG09848.1 hypothetical protein C5C11_14865 [Rathayibacter rathayi]